jgi:hypothetical protein
MTKHEDVDRIIAADPDLHQRTAAQLDGDEERTERTLELIKSQNEY